MIFIPVILIIVIVIIFISNDAPKRGMSSSWALIGLLGLLGLIIYLASRNPLNTSNNVNRSYNPPTPTNNLVIPDTCPSCHNPNNRKTRLCEWCGSQII